MVAQFHHACCDGLGAVAFIEDLLVAYAMAMKTSANGPSLCPIEFERLRGPARFGWSAWSLLKLLPRQLVGLAGVRQFFGHAPSPAVPSSAGQDAAALPAQYPAVLDRQLTVAETTALGLRVAARGGDRKRHPGSGLVPGDGRLEEPLLFWPERRLVAAGRADQPSHRRRSAGAGGKHREHGLSGSPGGRFRRSRGSAPRRSPGDGTNQTLPLGPDVPSLALGNPNAARMSCADGGYRPLFGDGRIDELWDCDGADFAADPGWKYRGRRRGLGGNRFAAPLRPHTHVAMAALTYAGRLRILLHYDPRALLADQAESLLDTFMACVRTSLSRERTEARPEFWGKPHDIFGDRRLLDPCRFDCRAERHDPDLRSGPGPLENAAARRRPMPSGGRGAVPSRPRSVSEIVRASPPRPGLSALRRPRCRRFPRRSRVARGGTDCRGLPVDQRADRAARQAPRHVQSQVQQFGPGREVSGRLLRGAGPARRRYGSPRHLASRTGRAFGRSSRGCGHGKPLVHARGNLLGEPDPLPLEMRPRSCRCTFASFPGAARWP